MAKTKAQKKGMVEELSKKIADAKAIFVIAPKAINPNEAAELKIKLAEIGGEYHVIKNTLFKIALKEAGLAELESLDNGQNAAIFIGENSPEAAKIMQKFIKDSEKAEFRQGFLEGKKLEGTQINALADLPSREQLIAQVIGTMNAPISGFVNVLAGNVRSIITVIDAIKSQKEGK